MSMPFPIDALSYSELEALEAQIAIRKRELHRKNAETVRSELVRAVQAEGLTIEEVFGPSPGRKLPQVRYRNPDNPKQTWPGRGRAEMDARETGARCAARSARHQWVAPRTPTSRATWPDA
ncbi:H-NS histone family protein [Alkalisalibacterium limincola]|uniref:H-NS histone family protein n=1 Tax=Alkalisalibacterium limincola TaxID=2699169 RepID=A0A5C8KZZ8_9GAMM|nr:H-NS histone family protein [Alkalisalibacterium limincola]